MQLYNCTHTEWSKPFKPGTRRRIRVKVKPIIRCRKCGQENGLPMGFANFLANLSTMRLFYNPVEILGYIEEENPFVEWGFAVPIYGME